MSFEGKSLTHLVSAQNGSYYKLLYTHNSQRVTYNNHEPIANYREAKINFPKPQVTLRHGNLVKLRRNTNYFLSKKKTCQTIVDLFNGHFFCSNSFSKSCAATTKFKEKCHIKVSLEKTNLCSLSPILKHFHLCVPRCFWNLFHGILHTSSYLTFCF